ncbi:MAG: hypothetical protein KBS53_04385 [Bacteroidales bacterium]|nr:hypothetical protein [Candidatus Hennigimonas equi]
MKIIFRSLSAVFIAALFALASCDNSDIDVGSVQQPAGGTRVIEVSFQNNSTKTVLHEDGLTPKFTENDEIMVANGTDAPEVCTVIVDGSGKATIATTLPGTLTAVYPATAAKMNGNAIDGVLVPTEQNGTFAIANISMATINTGVTSATFANQTALFKITPPDGVKQFTITSLKPVVDGVARTGTPVAINTEGEDDAAKLVISVGGASSDLTTFYVSLVAGVNLTDLKFEYETSGVAGMDGAIKGITEKSLSASSVSNVTAANTLYTIDANNWHPYVEIGGKKWATMNVGAYTVAGSRNTCYGDYFAWGETETYYESIDWNKLSYEEIITYKTYYQEHGYSEVNYKWGYSSLNGFTKYNTQGIGSSFLIDNKIILDLDDDAATQNWGCSWRMPKDAEFQSLRDACTSTWNSASPLSSSTPDRGVYTLSAEQDILDEYSGVSGLLFVGENPCKRVFFPSAGMVSHYPHDYDISGNYWTSLLNASEDNSQAYSFEFVNTSYFAIANYFGRYSGFPVRPVSD